MRRSLSVAVAVGVVALGAVTGGSASRGGGAGLIVYSHGGLYVVRSDGAGERRVMSRVGQLESSPSWSPDGKRLVFDSAPDDGSIFATFHGRHQLLLVTLATGRVSKLFDIPGGVGNSADPEWSPKGGVIAFTYDQGRGIYLVSPTGENLRRIPNTSGRDYAPSWAPGGKHLVFSRDGSIWITRIDGRNQRKLTIGPADASPSWSPDGKLIAFDRVDPGDHRNTPDRNVWVMNTHGTGLRKLTHQRRPTWDPITSREAGDPAWSPSGDRIAFVTTFDGMWLMNPDGTGKRPIAQGFLSNPDWQPG